MELVIFKSKWEIFDGKIKLKLSHKRLSQLTVLNIQELKLMEIFPGNLI